MRIYRQIILISALCMLAGPGFGQSQKSFDELVVKTNTFLTKYAELSPLGPESFIPLEKSGLPEEAITFIISEANSFEGLSTNKDSIEEGSLLLVFQDLIIDHIQKLIVHDKFASNYIEKLLSSESALSITISNDRKLYNFSLDEKTGGTYRSRISIMHYTEAQADLSILDGDGIDEIYALETEGGTKYVLTSHVRGCSYCFETSVMLVQFQEGVFVQDFAYSLSSRSWEEGVSYDPKLKTIKVDYTTDDLTTDCDCGGQSEENDSDPSMEDDNYPTTLKCHCTFAFDGTTFVLTEESSEEVKD